MVNGDQIERLGRLVDSMDNIIAATDLPMPAEFHLKQIRESIENWSNELKEIYITETGDNPWHIGFATFGVGGDIS